MFNFAAKLKVTREQFSDVEEAFKYTAFCFEDDTKQAYVRIFSKEATIEIRGPEDWIIHLGGPISYRAQDIMAKDHPPEWLFCIDAGGRNHGVDRPVYIHVDVMKSLINIARDKAAIKYYEP